MEIAEINLSYLRILFQSNFLECTVFALFYSIKGECKSKPSILKIFAVTTCSNCITHPIVFFGWMASGFSYYWAVLIAEAFAILGELFLHKFSLKETSWRRIFSASAAANLVSWQFGPMLTYTLNKIM